MFTIGVLQFRVFILLVHRFVQHWVGQALRRKISRTSLGDLALIHLHSMVQQRTAIDFEVQWMLHFAIGCLIGDSVHWTRWNAYGRRGRCVSTRRSFRWEHLLAWAGARSNRHPFGYIGWTQDNAFGAGTRKLRTSREKRRILWQSFDLQDRVGQFLLQLFRLNRAKVRRCVSWPKLQAYLSREFQNASLLLVMTFWLSCLLLSQITFTRTDKELVEFPNSHTALFLSANKMKSFLSALDTKRTEAA